MATREKKPGSTPSKQRPSKKSPIPVKGLFRTLVDLSNDLIWTLDRKGRFTYINLTAEKVSGHTLQELLGLHYAPLIPPEDLARIDDIFLRVLAGESLSYEVGAYGKDGSLFLLSVNTAPIRRGRAIVGTVSFGRDVTEERRQSDRLRLLGKMVEQVGEGIALADLEGNLLHVNPAWAQMHGYEPEELAGRPISIFHTQAQMEQEVLPFIKKVSEKGHHTGEVGHLRRDGTTFPTEMTTTLLKDDAGHPLGMIGFFKDITEQKRNQEEILRKSRQQAALLAAAQSMAGFLNLKEAERAICEAAVAAFEAKMAWIGLIDPATVEVVHLVSVGSDERDNRMLGVRWDESNLSRGPTGAAIKKRRPCVMAVEDPDFAPWAKAAVKEGYRVACAVPLLHDESVRGVITLYSGEPNAFAGEMAGLMDIFGRLATLVLVNASLYEEARGTIQELVQSNEELERAREEISLRTAFFEGLFSNSPEAIAVLDQENRVLNLNRAFERMFGYSLEEVKGLPLRDTIVPTAKMDEADDNSARTRGGEVVSMESVRRRKDGTLLPVSIMGAPVSIGRKQLGILAIYRDISALKAAEEALRESEKRLRAIFDAEPVCVKLLEADGTVIDINPAGLSMLGMTREEVVGQCIFPLVVPRDREVFSGFTRKVCQGDSDGMEFEIVGKNGVCRRMTTRATPVRISSDGTAVCLAITSEVAKGGSEDDGIVEGLDEGTEE